ncbi:flagellar basal body P-ring formation chaperone FlgA [Geotalea toluenoxydans]|uniref:flagellar basal body P-ring formation chaperone FlgA n=1 Tax=Geotalea toluenoxydans TaxID=421624 RepID=UPI0006D2B6B4|nr:flagellar basal body P-ring formation chaperone FlgA [Geotalea toluenoxydans]
MKRALLTALLLLIFGIIPALAASQTVKEAVVRQVVIDYLQQKCDNLGLEINIKKIVYSGDLSLSAGDLSYEVVAPDRWEGWGSANLALIIRVDGRVERNVPVKVEVEAMAEMVVAVRPLERGEVIGAADVAVQKRGLSRLQGRFVRDVDEVVGKRVRTAIRGNNPIRPDFLERVPLIKSGQLVTIVAENESLRITAAGKARNSGAEGDTVMVRNLASQKELPARVIDAETVKVDF